MAHLLLRSAAPGLGSSGGNSAIKKTLKIVRGMAADPDQHQFIIDSGRMLPMIVRAINTNDPDILMDSVCTLNLLSQNPDYVKECAFEPSLASELYRVRNDERLSPAVRRKASSCLRKLCATGELEWLDPETLREDFVAETPAVKRRAHAPQSSSRPQIKIEVADLNQHRAGVTAVLLRIRGVLSMSVQDSTVKVTTPTDLDLDGTPGSRTPSTPFSARKGSKASGNSPPSPVETKQEMRRAVSETRRGKGRKRDSVGGADWCAPIMEVDEQPTRAEYLDMGKFKSGGYDDLTLHASECSLEARAARREDFRREQERTADGLLNRLSSAFSWVIGA